MPGVDEGCHPDVPGNIIDIYLPVPPYCQGKAGVQVLLSRSLSSLQGHCSNAVIRIVSYDHVEKDEGTS